MSVHAQLRMYLLGSFRLEREGQTIHFPTRKVESLLAYLALHPQTHPREKIAALLWGGLRDEYARMSLRGALTTMRKTLGDTLLIADRETVQLDPGYAIWVDAVEFAKSAARESALELYGGDLLPDHYDDWITAERERLRGLYLDLLLRLAQQARSTSDYTRAIETAHRILESDPANEKAHQHLIFCLAATGNRAAALEQYRQCQTSMREELGVEPSSETIALYAQVRAEQVGSRAREALFSNLPIPMTSFVGRQSEIGQVKQLIRAKRLVTLTGAGGCGKTRLAIQVATELADAECFPHGVWWNDLAALGDVALVPQTIARVFNLSESPGVPLVAVLTQYLREKELLLVMDNCEHLVGACAQVIGTLCSACPRLHILATSREALSISGETVWRVPSLAFPATEHIPPLAQLRQYDAIQLFTERAQAIRPGWRLGENAVATAHICARLDGIPLAIELATARLKTLAAEDILARLEDRFNLLTGGKHLGLARHETLRAAMDWSHHLLSNTERMLLRQLSVFAGGFSIDAVEFVAERNDNAGYHVADILTALSDQSLVVAETHGGTLRYRLLETVRHYAREKLVESGQANIIQARHRDYFLDWIEQAGPRLWCSEGLAWCDRIELENDNLRAALDHALEHDPVLALRMSWAMRYFWSWRGLIPEGFRWLNRLLPKTEAWGASALRARALSLGAYLAHMQWNIPLAVRFAEEALATARAAGVAEDLGHALQRVGYSYLFTAPPNFTYAAKCLEASREIFRTCGDQPMLAMSTHMLGMAAGGCGDFARGVQLVQEAVTRCRATGNKFGEMISVSSLGVITARLYDFETSVRANAQAVELGRELHITINMLQSLTLLTACYLKLNLPRKALPCAEESLRLYKEQGSYLSTVICLELVALCFGALGRLETAARLYGKVELERQDRPGAEFIVPGIFEPEWAAIRTRVGDAGFDEARAKGQAMTLDEAVAYAMENVNGV